MIADLATQNAADPGAVRAALERVLARPEFQPEKHAIGDWIAKASEDFARWLSEFLGVSLEAARGLFAGVAYGLLIVIAAAAIVWMVRLLLRSARARSARVDENAQRADLRAVRAAELCSRARAAEAHGDHALALRLFFWALVVGLGERGGLEYRDAWTNRELLERGAPRPDVARVLAPLVPELDRKVFGRAGAGSADVAELATLCREMLGVSA